MVGNYLLVRVLGNSMVPTLKSGDFLLVGKTKEFSIGDLVVIEHGGSRLVKRIVDENTSQIWLSGDNVREGSDSRSFGWVEKDQIVGRVILRYWPKIKLNFKVN